MGSTTDVPSLNTTEYFNIIDGKPTKTKQTRQGINPGTGEALWPTPVSDEQDIEAAITAARKAFKTWKKTTVEDRKERLKKLAEAVGAHKAEFSKLLTTENGKPTPVADHEVDLTVGWLTGTTTLDLKDDVVEDTPEKLVTTQYLPLGVVVGIIPWNYPLLLLAGKLAPAVMTGNTIILKPSPFTPYAGTKLVELAQQFFPPGVVQVLSGDDRLGPLLTIQPGIDKISFTGSSATGKKVMESASKNLTRVTLELGGNDAAIVNSDVNLEAVVPQIAQSVFLNSGQICIAIKRVYVHKDIYEPFKEAFVNFVSALPVGRGSEPTSFIGPVQNKLQFERVSKLLDDVKGQNQKVLLGGGLVESEGTKGGYFVQPTIVDRPAEDSAVVVQEAFGPVIPLLEWSDVDDVIERANNSDVGLGATVWANDIELAKRIANELDVGSVWINKALAIQPTAAFAGHKLSGIGTDWGLEGLRGYSATRTLFLDRAA